MSRYLGIASVQRTAFPGDTDANIAEMETYMEGIAFQTPFVDIIVFPELCIQGFSRDFADLAQSIPGPAVEVRTYGTKGMCPVLKHLKQYGHKFPAYGHQKADGPGLNGLGKIPPITELPGKIILD